MRPTVFMTTRQVPGLRSVESVRASLDHGRAGQTWQVILGDARAELADEALTPASVIPGRAHEHVATANRDYGICHAASQRILRAALACRLNGLEEFRNSAWRQIESLLDERQWPDWRDKAHPTFPADLRTGMLSRSLAIAYDWLGDSLSPAQRQWMLEGIDRRGIQPFLETARLGPKWMSHLSNWTTRIAGGLGIAGMALGTDHPQSRQLVEMSLPLMLQYIETIGPRGEFNEAVGYVGALRDVVDYFLALRYARHAGWLDIPTRLADQAGNVLTCQSLARACSWMMYMTLPPGRLAAMGDAGTESPAPAEFVCAVASARGDEVLQDYYLRHSQPTADPMQLLWHDPGLAARSPDGVLPLGAAFPAHGGCVVSRSDWDSRSARCIVYGKASQERFHQHNDAGQVCLDALGQRLIVDLGKPSHYPRDFFGGPSRWSYYNASAAGHNVLMIDQREQRDNAGGTDGRIEAAGFDDAIGGWWRLDLAGAYEGVQWMNRTVAHLLPGVAAVLDEMELTDPDDIRLRWHVGSDAEIDEAGNFRVLRGPAALAGLAVGREGPAVEFSAGRHEYRPPFDHSRTGALLEQRHEPYVQVSLWGEFCRLLTLFAVQDAHDEPAQWREDGLGYVIDLCDGRYRVDLPERGLRLTAPDGRVLETCEKNTHASRASLTHRRMACSSLRHRNP